MAILFTLVPRCLQRRFSAKGSDKVDELRECVCLQRFVDGTVCDVADLDPSRGLFLSVPHLAFFGEPGSERDNGSEEGLNSL